MSNYFFVFVMSLFGVGLLKLQKNLMPRSYFFYARLIDGIDDGISWPGAIIRTLIPLIIGLISGAVAITFHMSVSPQNYGMIIGFLEVAGFV